jgi:hypothetical protein
LGRVEVGCGRGELGGVDEGTGVVLGVLGGASAVG